MNKFCVATMLAIGCFVSSSASADPVPLDALLKEIKVALVKVQRSPDSAKLPPLKTATLNATTNQKREAGGTFKLFIIEFGHKHTSELTTDVSISLSPPGVAAALNVGTPQISDALANAILAAARAIASARAGSPPLVASEVKASIKFGVSQDSNGKISLEFAPVTIGGEGSLSSSTAQEIVVIYKT